MQLERSSIANMKEKYWTIINYVLITLAGVVGFYVSSGAYAFDGSSRLLTVPETFIANGILLLAFSGLLIINIIRNNCPIIIIFILYFACSII